MKKALLDTSIIIDFLRSKNKENTLLFLLIKQNCQLYISIVTHTELFSGKSVWENRQIYEAIEKLCFGFNMFSIDRELSKEAGKIKAEYNTDLIDAIIAATAIYHDLDLVTLNIKDFEEIEGINLFKPN